MQDNLSKNLVTIVICFVVFMGATMYLNRVLLGKVEEVKAPAPAAVASSSNQPVLPQLVGEIPRIDPNNDPLAPRYQVDNPQPSQTKAGAKPEVVEPSPVYEKRIESDILVN